MIALTHMSGSTLFVAPAAIATITPAGPSGARHGIQSVIRTFDGRELEVRETPGEIADRVREAVPA